MNLFHGLQLLLAALVIALVVSRLRELCFESALDSVPFRRALLRWMEEDEDRAVRLVARARPAWVAVCLWPLFDPELDDLERSVEVEERLMDVSAASVRGMRALRLSASIASAFGFVVAAAHIWWVFNGDHGLRALQAGLVEGEGLAAAVLAIALGIMTSSFALGSWTILKRVARTRVREAYRAVGVVEEAILAGSQACSTEVVSSSDASMHATSGPCPGGSDSLTPIAD